MTLIVVGWSWGGGGGGCDGSGGICDCCSQAGNGFSAALALVLMRTAKAVNAAAASNVRLFEQGFIMASIFLYG